jgi:hypothetical protein
MINQIRLFCTLLLSGSFILLLLCSGCSQTPQPLQASSPAQDKIPSGFENKTIISIPDANEESEKKILPPMTTPENKISKFKQDRSHCYHLQPKGKENRTKGCRKTGHCQPQSLIYARCRARISTCRLGDTSPLQWFACARQQGNTSSLPTVGSVMVLDRNSRHGMPTGHPVYVEQINGNPDGTWTLRISHSNYDRKCHLDLDAKVLYDPIQMTASFQSGPWNCWACNLKVLGYIIR